MTATAVTLETAATLRTFFFDQDSDSGVAVNLPALRAAAQGNIQPYGTTSKHDELRRDDCGAAGDAVANSNNDVRRDIPIKRI